MMYHVHKNIKIPSNPSFYFLHPILYSSNLHLIVILQNFFIGFTVKWRYAIYEKQNKYISYFFQFWNTASKINDNNLQVNESSLV